MSNKIGLLLPRSVMYPTITFDMMAGLRHGLTETGIKNTEIKTENIGLGADPKEVYASCEKLIFEGCAVVVGYVNPSAAETLEPLFANAGAVFIALEAGYHFPVGGLKLMPHVFTLSLDGVLCCRIMSTTAVADGCRHMAFAGSFYEAGYRSVSGFYQGLQDAGGQITFNHVTPLKRADFSLVPLSQHIANSHPDGVVASFCGDMLQDFFAAIATGQLPAGFPIYGSSFMGDEIWLAQCPYPGTDVKVAVTWGSELENDANKQFKNVMAANKQRANIWSMIAWEAAQLVAVALVCDVDTAVTTLESLTFEGPRGLIRMNGANHKCYSTVYNGLVTRSATGNCQLKIIEESPYVDVQREALENDINNFDGMATSWKNAYGCLES